MDLNHKRCHVCKQMEETKTVEALAALAHQTRLRVFRALIEAGLEGLPAGALATMTGVPPSTLSSHLVRLEHAGLIQSNRVSRNIYYAIKIESVRALLAYLIDDCCAGRPDLCGDLSGTTDSLLCP
jgi:ArsR family transcriptional regulator, arsenate/arsenite/antimonite-responsive transcriptional repressor